MYFIATIETFVSVIGTIKKLPFPPNPVTTTVLVSLLIGIMASAPISLALSLMRAIAVVEFSALLSKMAICL